MYLQLKYLTVYALGQGIQRTYGFQIVSISAHVRRSVPVVFRQSLAGQAFPPSALYEQSYQSLLLTPRGLQAGHVHMYKTLHGQIPRYLSGDCQLISDASRRLRSSDTFTFAVPRTRLWVTDHLLLPDHRYGTVGRQICA